MSVSTKKTKPSSEEQKPVHEIKKAVVKATGHISPEKQFDRTAEFESKVAPLLEKLGDLCLASRLPFFFACCVASDKKSAVHFYDGVSPETLGIQISDKLFDKMLLVVNGFDAVLPINSEINDEGISTRANSMMAGMEDEE